jgi:hypothetical protein
MKKPIEVEGQEMAFKKVGNRYKLVKDFAGKPSHEEGGHPILAEEGMVITPAKDRKKVTNMVDNKTGFVKNNARFNSYRLTLPKDTVAGKAKGGVNDFGKASWMKNEGIDAADYQAWVDKNYPEFKTKNLSQLYPGKEMDNAIKIRNRYSAEKSNQTPSIPALNSLQPLGLNTSSSPMLNKTFGLTPPAATTTTSTPPTQPVGKVVDDGVPLWNNLYRGNKGFTKNKKADWKSASPTFMMGMDESDDESKSKDSAKESTGGNKIPYSVGALGELAPIGYNLVKGSQPIERVSRRFMNPELARYQNLSQPLIEQNKTDTYGANQRARNLSGGSMQSFAAQAAANQAQGTRMFADIQNQEAERKLAVQDKNIVGINNARGMNLGLANQYDDIEARRRGAAQNLTKEGFTGIGQNAKDRMLRNSMMNQDLLKTEMGYKFLESLGGQGTTFKDGQHSINTEYWKPKPIKKTLFGTENLEIKKKGTQGIKVPKYKKGTRYKTC